MNNGTKPADQGAVEAGLRQHGVNATVDLDELWRHNLWRSLSDHAFGAVGQGEPVSADSCICEPAMESRLRQIAGGPLDALHTLLRAACPHRGAVTTAREGERCAMLRKQASAMYHGALAGLAQTNTIRRHPWPVLSMEEFAYLSRAELEGRYTEAVAAILDGGYTADREGLSMAFAAVQAGLTLGQSATELISDPATTIRDRTGLRRRRAVRAAAAEARTRLQAAPAALTSGFMATEACISTLEASASWHLTILADKQTPRDTLRARAQRAAAHVAAMDCVLTDVHAGADPGAARLAQRRIEAAQR